MNTRAIILALVVAGLCLGAVAQAPEAGTPPRESGETESLVPTDWSLQIWTLVTFGAVMAVLGRFAYRPLQRLLAERDAAVRDTLEQARKARDEAAKALEQNAAQLDSARAQAREIVEQAQDLSQQVRREAEEDARKRAAETVDAARREINDELRRKTDELKSTVAAISTKIAQQLIKDTLDEKRHQQLVSEFVERLRADYDREPSRN